MKTDTPSSTLKQLIPLLAVLLLPLLYLLFFRSHRDLDAIKKSGTVRVLLSYDPINYFIYRGTPMGYSYEAAKSFCTSLGLQMEVVVVRDLNSQLDRLQSGEGDLVAHNLTITSGRRTMVEFSDPISYTRQVLIQKKNPRGSPLRSVRELDGRQVHVRKESAYYTELMRLRREEGIDVEIVTVPGERTTSELIRDVSRGAISYTVADRDIATAHRTLFPDIEASVPVSLSQPLAWAVGRHSPELLHALNGWLSESSTATLFSVLHLKYYLQQYTFRKRAISIFYSGKQGEISPYDRLIRRYAATVGWDWRLLASLIYEESQFDPGAVSWAGASGLMQLMPQTAGMYGIHNLLDPDSNIKAGTLYILSLQKEWQDIADPETRMKFILASYNVGPGHVRDAQALAKKFGKDPNLWEENVEHYLRLKSRPLYYRDEASKYGYCNGGMPVRYARNILSRYSLYSQAIPL
ncbi:transglycosylase SLT domain-containing protein [Pelodictyon luteolum]|uniref:Extracellular solute-binding protein, family 3 n=1 Tax=Chlorobium luteolum (strain DSM 273 / BCRC 81028 / 2530) TaxID=319225 RepID=Q3B465_CHLL3|nr:transporter substrate-binding domain-containing protein [Pelodictyon luteolum]ABB23866.1 extracellular solute-binding protein, family 3 [Pelodictyon luteolum DSM 273]